MAYKLGFKKVGSLLAKEKSVDGKEHRLSRFIPFVRGEGTEDKAAMLDAIGTWFDACQKFDKSKAGRVENGSGQVEKANVDYATFGATSPITPERVLAALWRGLSLDHTPEMQEALAVHRKASDKGAKVGKGKAVNFVE